MNRYSPYEFVNTMGNLTNEILKVVEKCKVELLRPFNKGRQKSLHGVWEFDKKFIQVAGM